MARGSWQRQTKESDALVKPRFRPCHICDRKYTDREKERRRGRGRQETGECSEERHRKPGGGVELAWAGALLILCAN